MIKLFPIRFIKDNTKIDFMGAKKINFLLSFFAILASIAFIAINSLNFGIDFTGGVLIEAKFANKPNVEKIRKIVDQLQLSDLKIQDFDDYNIMIRIGTNVSKSKNVSALIEQVKNHLTDNYGEEIDFRKTEYVGPQVGKTLIKKGILAITLSFAAIMAYVAFRFKWQYGFGIIIALIHDTILTLGLMSFLKLEFDLTSIAALLTIIGYSVNDSVVIYDRIRENFKKYKTKKIHELINLSINETLSRTILTVLTTLISIVGLIIYGGPALHSFSVTVFLGIVIGTYSSIYISAPILIYLGLDKNIKA